MKKPIALLIGLHPITFRHTIKNFQTILILSHSDSQSFSESDKNDLLIYFEIDHYDNTEALEKISSKILSQKIAIHSVVNHSELTQTIAGLMGSLLNVNNINSKKVLPFRDKRIMKKKFKKCQVRFTPWAELPVPKNIKIPLQNRVILKPSLGYGSQNAIKFPSIEEASQFLQNDTKTKVESWIAEDFVVGTEYNANTIWKDGKIVITYICENLVPRIDAKYSTNYDGSIVLFPDENEELYQEVENELMKLVDSFELNNDISHLEFFKKGNDNIILSEIASRPPGGALDMAFRDIFNKSLRELHIDSLIGKDIKVKWNEDNFIRGAINVRPLESGTISSLPNIDELKRLECVEQVTILKSIGDKYEKDTDSSFWCVLTSFKIKKSLDFEKELASLNRIIQEKILLSQNPN